MLFAKLRVVKDQFIFRRQSSHDNIDLEYFFILFHKKYRSNYYFELDFPSNFDSKC